MSFKDIYEALEFLASEDFTVCENPFKWEAFADNEEGVEECYRFSSDEELIHFASTLTDEREPIHARKRGGQTMPRCYVLSVAVKGITKRQLYSVMFAGFKWAEVSVWTDGTKIVHGTYEGALYWQSTDEAHAEIADAIRKLNPRAKVSTRWTYLEDLPCVEHGDDMEEEAKASSHIHLKGGESKWDLRK